MSYLANITRYPRYTGPRNIYYATITINTNIPGYHQRFKAAIHTINSQSAPWRETAQMWADAGYTERYQDWLKTHWQIFILSSERISGTYHVRIYTEKPLSWLTVARHLRATINRPDASWPGATRMNLCLRITPGRPNPWPWDTLGNFQISQVRRGAARRTQRRGPA